MSTTKQRLARAALVGVTAALFALSVRQARADDTTLSLLMRDQARAETPADGKKQRKTRGAKRISSGPVTLHTRRERRSGNASREAAALAESMGVPVRLALAVCQVESGCRHGLTGAAGEKGALQIKPATARMLGYSGPASALSGSTGLYWGMRHLAAAWRGCGTFSGAAKRHNAGLGASCSGSGYSARVIRLAGRV